MERDLPRSYRFGEFYLDGANRQLRRNGVELFLRPKTFDTLVCLVERHGRLVKKDDLMDEVWAETHVSEAVLTHCIAEARKALEDDPVSPRYIKTIPRVGYKFIAEALEVDLTNDRPRSEGHTEQAVSNGLLPLVKLALEELGEEKKTRRSRVWYWISAVSAVVVIGVGWSVYLLFSPRPPAMRESTIIPITTVGAGDKAGYVALSPSGARIAFSATGEEGQNWDIYLKDVDGQGLSRVTTDPAEEDYPSWSPDGRRLAFIRSSHDRRSLNLVSLPGGTERTLAELEPGFHMQVQNRDHLVSRWQDDSLPATPTSGPRLGYLVHRGGFTRTASSDRSASWQSRRFRPGILS